MKKKILFAMPYLGCGGVESALFSLLDVIDKEKYDITLLLLEKKGDFVERIPDGIDIRYIEIPEKEKGIFYGKKHMLQVYLKRGQLWKILKFLIYNLQNGLTENRTQNAAYFERISDTIQELDGEYDLAIDYFGYATFTTFYVAEKVHARIKVSWLHSILSRFSPQAFFKWYEKMDVIFSCSQMVKADFEAIFPQIDSVKLFYNIINPETVRKRAKEQDGFEDDFHGIRILTVGRICHEKGIDLAVDAFKRLVTDGYNIRWYVVGGGSEADINSVKANLKTDNEKANFVLLGVKSNPYPYMRQCDIYVQPSRFEGYCTTTNEARIIGCPIVMTDVSGAREQVENGKTGLIVESSADSIYTGVKRLLDSPQSRKQFVFNLKAVDCDTRKEVEKLYKL